MAGNKALKKFEKSKIPKKGTGPSIREINIYKEPNTHSELIGKIKSGESISWIGKSICDNREWIRCDKNQNFGYVIGTEEDGNYNFNVDKIIKCPEKKTEVFIPDSSTLTNEELKLGEDALIEILNEDDLKNNNEEESNENSTEAEQSSFENKINYKFDIKLDNLNSLNFSDINFQLVNDLESKQADHILNEIITEIEKEQKPKIIQIPKKDENPEKKEEEPSKFKRILSSIADLIPIVGNIKSGYEAIIGNDLITNEKLDPKERIISALGLIPGINYINKGNKIRKSATICNLASKNAIKASKTVGKKEGKKISETVAKKEGKKNKTDKNVKTNEEKKPEDWPKKYSEYDNFHQAFRAAKKENNIPLSRQPEKIGPNINNQEKVVNGKVFEFKDVNNKSVKLRWDKDGHFHKDTGTEIPPHINDPNKMHYLYPKNPKKEK